MTTTWLRSLAKKSAKALLPEAEMSVTALAAAEEREQCSAAILTKRGGELVAVAEKLRQADEHIQSLQKKFTRARDKFDELQGGATWSTRWEVLDNVAEGAGTVGAPEEMRTDEDSQGPSIDALTEDPRLDDVFGETEAEGAPVTQVAPPGVDEETVP
ncbi:hypothetical protein AALP_AA8G329800 [Arabis alpina]|uniref:Uncharacterized protein n=1 Tax=Arabis alpina TaxID=50452 RepID=A0A087GB12_ARAAL|nr:hypothetical protein AALP_AA8G329800 [Arabis alpina]